MFCRLESVNDLKTITVMFKVATYTMRNYRDTPQYYNAVSNSKNT